MTRIEVQTVRNISAPAQPTRWQNRYCQRAELPRRVTMRSGDVKLSTGRRYTGAGGRIATFLLSPASLRICGGKIPTCRITDKRQDRILAATKSM